VLFRSGDSIFHYLFKSAWHNSPELTCYGDGNNVLPTIHVDDLSSIIFELSETTPNDIRYLLAVDDSKQTLLEITKAVSESLGSGKVVKTSRENALLTRTLGQTEYDMLLTNLRLDPGHVKEMSFEWKYELGIVENLPTLIQEYKDSRGLLPLKIIIHGPPASGKTPLAAKIAKHYGIHRVDVESVVTETLARLERHANLAASVDTANLSPDEGDIEADKELWEEIQEALSNLPAAPAPAGNTVQPGGNSGSTLTAPAPPPTWTRIPQEFVINIVKEKLKSMPCKNQGYVLDGFPTTFDSAGLLFKSQSEEEEKSSLQPMDSIIGPEFVISLQITDEIIKERNMNLPENVVSGTKYAEDVLIKRLEEFRSQNHDENTVLNYFDEHEVHPFEVDVGGILSAVTTSAVVASAAGPFAAEPASLEAALDKVLALAREKIGEPRNYGPTFEQLAERKRSRDEALLIEAAVAEEERLKKEKEENERHNKSVSEWNSRLEEVRKQEQEVLEAQSVPLRNYLMKHVMPTLTAGLIDVCKVRPDDPIDYLAEFLFKQNPTSS